MSPRVSECVGALPLIADALRRDQPGRVITERCSSPCTGIDPIAAPLSNVLVFAC